MITIEQDNPGQVRFTIPSKVGDLTVKLGGADSEHAYIQPAGFAFRYRGRYYTGQLVLFRDRLTAAPGYGFMLKTEQDRTSSGAVHRAIAAEATAAILETLKAYPEVLAEAERVSLQLKYDNAHETTERLVKELAAARQAEDELRAQLGGGPRTDHEVIDNITGWAVRQGLSESAAVHLCSGLNLHAGPGGRYGVRPVPNNQEEK